MTKTFIAAALAAALAVPAVAQEQQDRPSTTLKERIRRAQEGARPAPTPQPQAQGQASAQQTQQQGQLSRDQLLAFGQIHARNSLAQRAAELAETRAQSPQVKSLARKLVDQHRRAAEEFASMLSQRGGDVKKLASTPELQQIETELQQLASKKGEEFDREFIAFETRNHAPFVEDAKRARDVTPGKDSTFKKWLDTYENMEEAHLTSARQLKAQRQARTPPAR